MRVLCLIVAAAIALGFAVPVHKAEAATTVTLKLCPDGSTVAYTAKCPTAGTVRKICPSGAIVLYAVACPAIAPQPVPLVIGGGARANIACQSMMNPADVLTVGDVYRVTGFAGLVPIGSGAYAPENARDVVILDGNDTRHNGDGYFAWWVPANCVEGFK